MAKAAAAPEHRAGDVPAGLTVGTDDRWTERFSSLVRRRARAQGGLFTGPDPSQAGAAAPACPAGPSSARFPVN